MREMMREQVRKLESGLAMIFAILLLFDAEIIRRLFVYGLSLSWIMPERAGAASSAGTHEPAPFVLVDRIVCNFFALLHLAAGWLVWRLWRRSESGKSPSLHLLLGDERIT
jgi:hypothetical protein